MLLGLSLRRKVARVRALRTVYDRLDEEVA
jgi:hypothetical protein